MKCIGTKTVSATPAWRIDGKVYPKDGQVPRSMNREDGYKVVYEDGYESWSPKDVFEKAYKITETYFDRLQIEHDELTQKYDKCEDFVTSQNFRDVVKDDYPAFLLLLQRNVMNRYGSVLEQRMAIAKGETSISTLPRMSFGDAIEALKFGFAVRRSGWNGKGLWVIKQVPAHITEEVIPKMQSLPQSAKDLILSGKKFIDYTSQCLIYNENTGRADSWVPSISDVFAEDWEIVM